MRYYNIEDVEPGQILGKSIYTASGQVLLAEGVQMTVYMINTLRRLGATAIYVREEQFEDIEIEEVVSEETKQVVINQMSAAFDAIKSGKQLPINKLRVSIDSLLDEVMRNNHVLLQLSDIRTADNEAYVHAVNVCMMSILIGISIQFNVTQLKELAIGALLHDVGKVGLDEELSPENQEKNHHTWRGFDMLKSWREFSLLSAHVAFQHHESIDGKGVPRRLTDEQIHPYAKIVAVANTYDNLISPLKSGQTLLPHEAAEKLMTLVGTELDHNMVTHFLKTISIYPTGTSVRLSNRQIGVVVGQHKGLPSRPIVRIVNAKPGDSDWDIQEIDLAKHPTIFIESTLN